MDISKETRRESYEQISLFSEIRRKLIIDVLTDYGELTAQELATELCKRGHIPSDERNFTAPRITELRLSGKIKSVGKTHCTKTGRKVTIWAVS